MVGDSLTSDILGGLRSGMHTCWLNLRGIPGREDIRPEWEIRSLFELPAVIAGIFLIGCILLGIHLYIGARRADEMDSLIERQRQEKKLTREIIEASAKVVDLEDAYTQGHSFRVARYTEMPARELGYDD